MPMLGKRASGAATIPSERERFATANLAASTERRGRYSEFEHRLASVLLRRLRQRKLCGKVVNSLPSFRHSGNEHETSYRF